MVSFIILPPLSPLSHTAMPPLSASTAVTVVHTAQSLQSPLGTALRQFPKAVIALHPVDAPLHTVTLPPLAAQRREAALRVKLEDALLSDTAQLTLAVQTLGKHAFSVAYVSSPLLSEVIAGLSELGHNSRAIVALASHLPLDQEHSLMGWTVWRDAQGAGALPPSEGNAVSALNVLSAAHLSGATSPFTRAQAAGAAWQRWGWAALLAALCGVVYILGLWLHSRQLLALERATNRATAAAFQDTLPNTPMIDPVKQLRALSASDNALTSALAMLPADWPQGMVTQLKWESKRLSVTANAAPMKLTEAQQKQLTEAMAAKNIALTWSKP